MLKIKWTLLLVHSKIQTQHKHCMASEVYIEFMKNVEYRTAYFLTILRLSNTRRIHHSERKMYR